eukprot:7998-Chlamydomonas_euryale.AAC.2
MPTLQIPCKPVLYAEDDRAKHERCADEMWDEGKVWDVGGVGWDCARIANVQGHGETVSTLPTQHTAIGLEQRLGSRPALACLCCMAWSCCAGTVALCAWSHGVVACACTASAPDTNAAPLASPVAACTSLHPPLLPPPRLPLPQPCASLLPLPPPSTQPCLSTSNALETLATVAVAPPSLHSMAAAPRARAREPLSRVDARASGYLDGDAVR